MPHEADHDVDLFLEGTLRDLVYIWRGDLPLAHALDTGRLRAHGTVRAQRALPHWLATSPLAHVESAREDAEAV
jgi:putative sterol carrier protein